MSKKHLVVEKVYQICKAENRFEFDNDLVKKVAADVGFGNPFDATKFDSKSKLPATLLANDIAIIHLGGGMHRFIKGIDKVFHDFEPIDSVQNWTYKKSLLNQFNSSESNILSVVNNQRLLHQFLFSKDNELADIEIVKRAKTYLPHRTKTSFEYEIYGIKVRAENLQIEVDLTIEFGGDIFVFEAKNGVPDSFSIYQLYHPFLYYTKMANMHEELRDKIKNIFGVYVVRETMEDGDIVRLWSYTFVNPWQMDSIRLIKSQAYKLISV